MKKQFKIMVIVCMLLSLIVSPAFAASKQLTFAGTQAGGTFFILCGAFAQVVNKYMPDYEATPTPSSGSFENVRNIRDGVVDLAAMMPNVAAAARDGVAPWTDDKYDGMRALFNTYTSPFMMITQAGSGITSISDMKEKRVNTGAPGSTQASIFELILPHYEMDINTSFQRSPLADDESVSAIVDEQIDVATFLTAVSSPGIQELTTTADTRFISVNPDVLTKVEEQFPYFVKGEIPANTFKLQTEPVSTVLLWGQIVCDEKADEEFVYQFVKNVFEHKDEIEAVMPLFKELTEENATVGIPVPLHPGAIRYYKEKGIKYE